MLDAIGPYRIVAKLGEGGMGEVYRATDTSLNRAVAIKVLPDAVATDPERLARFDREAKTLAALNHPNIAQIHGLERSEGTIGLVLELVEGPTLADRIAQGAIHIDDALSIAKQIAQALEAAHEQGIIHRDLKPANIKIRDDGTVKVLDFGLAKVMESGADSSPNVTQSPTITTPAQTLQGVILGTAAYMSPEQAKGKPADKRSDMWAFGCVLYEILTGRRAFLGEDISDTLANVLKAEADWSALPVDTPAPIRRVLRRCLEKDRKGRFADASDVRLEIEDALGAPAVDVASAAPRQTRIAWAVAALAVIGLAAASWLYVRETSATIPETRLDIVTPSTIGEAAFALSPDGRQVVFVASSDGVSRLWLRPLASTTSQLLRGTDGAASPFWSPDSRSVAFIAGGQLKRLDLGGGLPQTLVSAAPRGGTWNSDGLILFVQSIGGPLFSIRATGGEARAVTLLGKQAGHRYPQFLPDGRHFLFYALGSPESRGIYLGSLDDPQTTRLIPADSAGAYLQGDWLLFVRGGTLFAQRLDLERSTVTGDPTAIADSVASDANIGVGALSTSNDGMIAYRSGGAGRRQLTWFNRDGKILGALGPPDEGGLNTPRLSPDGRRVAAMRTVDGNSDIWLMDADRSFKFTFDAAVDRVPIWSPDGGRIVFDSSRKVSRDLFIKPSNLAGQEEPLLESPQAKVAGDWSPDGRFISFATDDPQTRWDLWILSLDDKKPWPFLKTSFDERRGMFSRDGRWIAYHSNESGRYEIYVRPFPGPGAPQQISTGGGFYAVWAYGGKELYYVAPDSTLMAVPIATTGEVLEPGRPVALFKAPIHGGTDVDIGLNYDVARDGRFLINTVPDDAATTPITLIQNWKPPAN